MPECNGGFKLTLVYERWWPGAREDREQPEIADRLFDLYEHAQFARSDRSQLESRYRASLGDILARNTSHSLHSD